MANEYGDKDGVISYWLFAHDFNAVKAANHLTPSTSSPTFVNDYPAAPDHGINCASASNQWAYRTNTDLSADFPLKSTDPSNKKVSWAFWFTTTTSTTLMYMVAKYSATAGLRSLAIGIDGGVTDKLWIGYGYGAGTSPIVWNPGNAIVDGRKYHVGLAVDGVARTALVRLYDSVLGQAYTYTKTDWGYDLLVATAPFVVGNRGNLDTANDYNGKIGGLMVANYVMTADEFDAIRLGTFNQANPSTLNLALSMQQVNIAGDYAHQSFIIF